jgi:hypothetical protein
LFCRCGWHTPSTTAARAQDDQLLTVLAEPLLAAARAQSQLGARALLQACQCGAQLQAQAEAVAAQLREHYYSLTARLQAARAQVVVGVNGLFPLNAAGQRPKLFAMLTCQASQQ